MINVTCKFILFADNLLAVTVKGKCKQWNSLDNMYVKGTLIFFDNCKFKKISSQLF